MLVFRYARNVLNKLNSSSTAQTRAQPSAEQNFVPCAHCGVHLPESEAIRAGERFYCSRRHLEAEQRGQE
jgi:uncharacterized protein